MKYYAFLVLLLFTHIAFGQAPATLTQSVTHNGQTYTLNLKREDLRGQHFEVETQNASGGYDVVTDVVPERSYIGVVEELSGAVACGIRRDNGVFKGAIYLDRGETWFIEGNSVYRIRGNVTPTFRASSLNVNAGQGGTTMYAFDVAVDVDNDYYVSRCGSNVAQAIENIELSVALTRAIYMRDALLRPYLGRIIIRATKAQDPYDAVGGGTYLNAVRNEWTNHADAIRDVVCAVTGNDVGGGLAYVGTIGDNFSGVSVNDSDADGNFSIIWRHELGHNWGSNHFEGGTPEGASIMSGNQYGRFSCGELRKILDRRATKLSFLDVQGTYTNVELPPYASMDVVTAAHLTPLTINVLANDHDANGQTLSVASFESSTANGGTITQQGNNLIYTAPNVYTGEDFFTYIATDSSGKTATGIVAVNVRGIVGSAMPENYSTNQSVDLGALTWETNNPQTTAYHVYLGTDRNAVTNATTSSPEYLGQSASTSLALSGSLSAGRTYFWRVDAQTPGGTSQGPVWSFNTNVWTTGTGFTLTNWARQAGVTASQSTIDFGGVALRAIDGNTGGNWNNNEVTHTDASTPNNWWEVDLGTIRTIGSINLYNRTDCCQGRLSNFRVSILDASRTEVLGQNFYVGSGAVGNSELWQLASAVNGRYVRVQLINNNNEGNAILTLAEVEVLGPPTTNIALTGATASQSTTYAGSVALRAIDGNTDGNWSNGNVTHTDGTTANNWLDVQLSAPQALSQIVLYNRTDCCSNRLSNFRVSVWNGATEVLGGDYFTAPGSSAGPVFSIASLNGIVGDRVRIQLRGNNNDGNAVLALAEVQIYGANQILIANDSTFSIAENAAVGTTVGTADVFYSGGNSALNYAITAGNAAGLFSIDLASGAIVTTGPLDYETATQHVLTVTATVNGQSNVSDTATVTVTVTDVTNDDSDADGLTDEWEVTNFGSVSAQNGDGDPDGDLLTNAQEEAAGSDPNAFTNEAGNITAQASAIMGVHNGVDLSLLGTPYNQAGALTNLIDNNASTRADTWNSQGTETHSYAGAIWPAPRTDAIQTVRLKLATFTDGGWFGVNGASPAAGGALVDPSHLGASAMPVLQTTTNGGTTWVTVGNVTSDYLTQMTGHTIGGGGNPNPSSRIVTFTLNTPVSGINGIRVIGTEGGTASGGFIGVFELDVIATESSNQPPSVTDATFSVAENATNGASVGTVTANDPENGTLSYSITSGNAAGLFAINASGNVTTTGGLDFETASQHVLTIQVSDGALTDTATVTVNVTNVNEVPSASNASGTLAENGSAGAAVATVAATDPDAGDSLSYAITAGNGSGLFAVDANGNVTTTGGLNFEVASQHVLTVTVSDSGALSDTATVTVNVTNVNEAPSASDVAGSVAENGSAGATVASVSASDPDAGTTLGYTITSGNSAGLFAVNASGNVTTTAGLDFETANQYLLTVQVSDGALTDTATVTINVINVNEAPSAANVVASVAERGAAGAVVGTVTASDPENDTLSYQITAGNDSGLFAIAANGQVTTTAPLDFEVAAQHVLTVTVSDSTLTDTATVTVNVTEDALNITAGASAIVGTHNAADLTTLGDPYQSNHSGGAADIIDNDVSDVYDTWNASGTQTHSYFGVTWSAVRTDHVQAVEIDFVTYLDGGWFGTNNSGPGAGGTLADPTHVGTASLPVVQVTSDGGTTWTTVASTSNYLAQMTGQTIGGGSNPNPKLMPMVRFELATPQTGINGIRVIGSEGGTASGGFVSVAELNVFASSNLAPSVTDATFSVAERGAAGAVVGTVVASDPENDTLSYSITAGNGSGLFAIASNGQVTTTGALDFEASAQHVLTVTVTDSGALSDTATVTINVTEDALNITAGASAIVGTHNAANLSTLGDPYQNNHSGAAADIIDNDLSDAYDTWNASGTQTHSYVGVTWPVTRTDSVQAVEIDFVTYLDGGWFGVNNSGPGAGGTLADPAHVGTASLPVVQVTSDGGTTWTTVASTNNYLAQMTGQTIGGGSNPNPKLMPMVRFELTTPQTGINGIRVIGSEGGTASGGFLAVAELNVFAAPSAPLSVTALTSSAIAAEVANDMTQTETGASPQLVRTTVNNVSSTSWTTVDLGQSYTSAVIVATPIYPNSTVAPVVTRIRNVSGSNFELKLDRADGQTGAVTMNVSVIAVEEGVYTQAADGVTMEAVKYTSTITGRKNAWTSESRTYQNSYTNPVVVGQVMSANDANWSSFWCHGSSRTNPPNASNLNVGKMIAEDTTTTRANEMVGYIVIEAGNGSINGVNYTAGLGADTVRGIGNTSTGYNYSLSGLSSASAAAVSLAGLDEGDGGWAVLYGATPFTNTQLTVAVDEDQRGDSERDHTTEQCGYIIFE